ncbi:ran-binding protein 6-like [Neltuma alba]|uniref:ran-binding protein 6-like n=1 Tax=Neltuma alba TaxID=207710 RepID=UPI0010A4D929|nr:ran-binding protein 6-like [Prosopis alba]
MASATSGSKRSSRPASPPPPPRRREKRERVNVRKVEKERFFNKKYQRRYGKGIHIVPAKIRPESSKEAKRRRRIIISVQDYQELTRAEINELQFAAVDLFDSNNHSRYLSLVCDFANASVSQENPQSQFKALWHFCAHRFPNDLSLMLARLLNSSLPSGIRIHTLDLLHLTLNQIHGQDRSSIDERVLVHLKPLLLNVIQHRETIPNMLNLSEIAARIFEIERWNELLDYLYPRPFIPTWKRSKKWPSGCYRALTFDASVKLVRLLHRWKFYDGIDHLLATMIRFLQAFHKDGQIDIVEPRMMDLAELARYYTDYFLKRLDVVLDCMFQVAATADDNAFLKCQAIQIIKIIDEKDMVQASQFLHKLSNEAKRSIIENCVRLMFCIADVPAWYDIDTPSSEYTGISGSYQLGKFLLFRVSLDAQEDVLVSFGIEMIPQYLTSADWQTRHAGLIAFSAIGGACGPEVLCDHAERVLEISLTDRHPRVLWAAIEAIICLITDSDQEHVQYLNKFLPGLVTIIRSSSIYPRVQLHAAIVIRRLITNCGAEEVKSFLEDLVPELLNLLKRGEKFWEEAAETLKLLAVSFPVLLTVYRIAKNWMDTDNRVKIHILKALSQLCKLPQLVADQFLNKIMPVLIQTLENTNPYIMTLTIDKQNSTCPKQRLLACDLLSKFAARFQEQFAPWAARVSPLLTCLFSSTDPDAKITSVRALPSILLSCEHRKQSQRLLFNFTVRALVEALHEEIDRAMRIGMLKSLNACIAISGTVFHEDLIKKIADRIYQVLSQKSFANVETETGEEASSRIDASDKREPEEEIIQGENCMVTMIYTLKSAFLTHADKLLPAVEALWGRDNDYPDRVKAVAITIFNLILKDYPDRLQRYRDTYALVVMDACYSESPQLQREAARGIGLCATHRGLIPNFDGPVAIDSLYHLIERGAESGRALTYDAAVSALGKVCEFRREAINGPRVVPIWLNFLPLRIDFEEAKYAHRQLCQMLERADQDLLGLNNENLNQAVQILKEVVTISS